MHIFIVNPSTNHILFADSIERSQQVSLAELYQADFPSMLIHTEVTEVEFSDPTELAEYIYDPVNLAIKKLQIPLATPISASDINAFRDELDESPVTMDGYTFDADQLSLRKMTDVANFVGNDQELTWTLADNSTYTFTGSAFKTIVDRAKKGQTKRSYAIHLHAKMLKTSLPNVDTSVLDKSLWPTATNI